MRSRKWWIQLLRLLNEAFYWSFLLYAVAAGAALKINDEDLVNYPTFGADLVEILQYYSFFLLPACAIVTAVTAAIRPRFRSSKTDKAIKALLDTFRSKMFPEEHDDTDYRVTLFRKQRWCWPGLQRWINGKHPWSGWLRAFERSGEFTLASSVKFHAPMGDPHEFEGFAGMVFRSGNVNYQQDLPDLSKKGVKSSQTLIQRYATATGVDSDWVKEKLKKKKPLPRSLWGITIEVNGKRWGVIVVDSPRAKMENEPSLKESFRPFGTVLSNLLKS